MTARLPTESSRATSWSASPAQDGSSAAPVAGRRIGVPGIRPHVEFEPRLMQLALDDYDGYPGEWYGYPARERRPHWMVRPAEVLALALTLLLAVHLLGGGASDARAPQAAGSVLTATARSGALRAMEVPLTPSAIIHVSAAELLPLPALVPATPEPVPQEADSVAATAAELPDTEGAGASSIAEVADEPAAVPAGEGPAVEEPAAVAHETPAETATTAPGVVLSVTEIEAAALAAGWPAELAGDAARVAWCESRFDTGALGYGTYGLMQLIPAWFDVAGIDFALWTDPVANLRAAWSAYQADVEAGAGPWAPWTCKPEFIDIP